MMENSLLILSGGLGKRMSFQFKPVLRICGKTLIESIIERLLSGDLFLEAIIVVKNSKQKNMLENLIKHPDVRIVEDIKQFDNGPLVAMYTGARYAKTKHVFLVAVDYPLMTIDVAEKLLLKLRECDAVIPKWPNGFIEPLVSAYRREELVKASYKALTLGMRRARAPLKFLNKPCLINVFSLSKNPQITFMNINTYNDLLRVRELCENLISDRGS